VDKFLERILVLETLEKIFRTEAFLSKASIRATEPDLKVIRLYQSAAEKILNSLKEPVLRKLHNDYGDLDHEERFSCIKRIHDVFTSVESLHYNLKNIHGEWTVPETYIFVTNLFKSVLKKDDVSIVLSDLYDFQEIDLSRYTKGMLNLYIPVEIEEETPTLFLPKIEYSNPLNWAILVHEMGHTFKKPLVDIFSNIKDRKISTTAEGIETIEKWTVEVWCDLIASKLLGPSYLASYIVHTLLVSSRMMEAYSPTHPAHRFRISIMKAFLEKCNMKLQIHCDFLESDDMTEFFDSLFEECCDFERENYIQSLPPHSEFPIDYQKLRDFLIGKIDALTHEGLPYLEINNEKMEDLTKIRLSNGVLIGSYRERQKVEVSLNKLKEIDNIMVNNKNDKIDDLMKQALEGVKENHNHIGEIINAGWKYKCEKLYPEMIHLFFTSTEKFDDCYSILKNEVFLLDDKLRKSVEISYIHDLFSEE
jgi:hypothetical protein